MQVCIASTRVALAVALSFLFISSARAQQPVEIETDAGVVTMVVSPEGMPPRYGRPAGGRA